ncbi:MAG TPA: MFS transporter [Solirubrobacteraceae bacterium]|nr:MFS transporter [Solirubrobacteraceae bacterium]
MTASEIAGRTASALGRALLGGGRLVRGQVVELVGGPARARVIAMFGAVLGLGGADTATVGAAAPQLEHALDIGNAGIGLLSSAALLAGALLVIPMGMLVDHVRRVPLLALAVSLWSTASLLSAFAGSYKTLLLTRLALGAVTATAGPAIASLTGDYFPAQERGRVYAYILGGEIAGSALGFVLGGTIASAISWRAAFVLLAIPGFFLARALWRTLPEPARGGQSHLHPGAESLQDVAVAEAPAAPEPPTSERQAAPAERQAAESPPAQSVSAEPPQAEPPLAERPPAAEAALRRGILPNPRLVLRQNAGTMGLLEAVRYVMSIPSYVLLVMSSSLGYFFFAGLQTFVLLFMRGHYHLGQLTAELVVLALVVAALLGTVVSGRVTDALLRRGFLQARIRTPAICYLGAAALLVPGVVGSRLTPALWFDMGATALIAAANPPLEAARLDVMPAGLWGRAEGLRGLLRSLSQALAPLVFGGLADAVAGIAPEQAPIGTHPGVISPSSARGLEVSFLIMLCTLAAAGVLMLRAQRTYPEDVATAAAAWMPPPEGGPATGEG